jgi:hypothetical protein
LENLREVNYSEANSFAQHQNMISHLETSAKENTNVDETFTKLAKVRHENEMLILYVKRNDDICAVKFEVADWSVFLT